MKDNRNMKSLDNGMPLGKRDVADSRAVFADLDDDFWLKASEPSLDAIWDNCEDDVYAELLESAGETMSTFEEILRVALALPAEARAMLAVRLLESLDGPD
jgi:hypothetical protein